MLLPSVPEVAVSGDLNEAVRDLIPLAEKLIYVIGACLVIATSGWAWGKSGISRRRGSS